MSDEILPPEIERVLRAAAAVLAPANSWTYRILSNDGAKLFLELQEALREARKVYRA